MRRIDTDLPGVCVIEPVMHGDQRGFFMESWREDRFAELGITARFVQDNCSRSARHVLRGLHWQIGRPQAKLVRCIRGAVFDVAVDIRRGSPTFGRWMGTEINENNRNAVFVPRGFAHGFLVLSDLAEVEYRCDDYYAPSEERGLSWNDPAIGITWPVSDLTPVLSGKDAKLRTLADQPVEDLPVYRAGE